MYVYVICFEINAKHYVFTLLKLLVVNLSIESFHKTKHKGYSQLLTDNINGLTCK